MKELWIRRDEAWWFYDSKPTCDVLGLDKPVDACIIHVSDEEYAAYEAFLAESTKWQTFFEENCRKKKNEIIRIRSSS